MERGGLVPSSTTPPLKRGMTTLRCPSIASSGLLCFSQLNEMLCDVFAGEWNRCKDEDSEGIIDDESWKGRAAYVCQEREVVGCDSSFQRGCNRKMIDSSPRLTFTVT